MVTVQHFGKYCIYQGFRGNGISIPTNFMWECPHNPIESHSKLSQNHTGNSHRILQEIQKNVGDKIQMVEYNNRPQVAPDLGGGGLGNHLGSLDQKW